MSKQQARTSGSSFYWFLVDSSLNGSEVRGTWSTNPLKNMVRKIHIHMCVYICLFCGVSLRWLPALRGHSEAFLEGGLDILQQAPLSSVLSTPIWCYHLQSEAESHGTSHEGNSSLRELGPGCRLDATHFSSLASHADNHMRQVPLTLFYR